MKLDEAEAISVMAQTKGWAILRDKYLAKLRSDYSRTLTQETKLDELTDRQIFVRLGQMEGALAVIDGLLGEISRAEREVREYRKRELQNL